MFRTLFAAVVALSLFTVAAPPASACRLGKCLKAVGNRVTHPFNGRLRKGC